MPSDLWVLVLAGGSGRRLAAVTGGVPKQFWAGSGRTLLSQTIDRVMPLTSPRRIVTVVDRSHREYLHIAGGRRPPGLVLYQPEDRGTAVGVLFGLDAILVSDPAAIVLVTPADHGVRRPDLFRERVEAAVRSVVEGRTSGVLFGAEPDGPASDFGWITPGPADVRSGYRPVLAFVEKPSRREAARLFAAGAVWNTMVLVARGRALRALYRWHLPEVCGAFDDSDAAATPDRAAALAARYRSLPPVDFSRDVLARADGLAIAVFPAALGWTDLGTPQRLHAWQQAGIERQRRVCDVA